MQPERFESLLSVRGSFVSIYIDDSRNTADAEAQLDAKWANVRRHLVDRGWDDDIIVTFERAVLSREPAVGLQGRGVIATGYEVLVNEHLVGPPSATVKFACRITGRSRPWWSWACGARRTYSLPVDDAGADITLDQGHMVRSETIYGGGYPVNKPATAGWNGYGDFQHSTEEAIRMNERAVVDRLTELVDKTGAEVVFVCGEVMGRTDVVSALPERVAARVCQLQLAGALGRRIGGGRNQRPDRCGVRAAPTHRNRVDRPAVPQTGIRGLSGLTCRWSVSPEPCVAPRRGDADNADRR